MVKRKPVSTPPLIEHPTVPEYQPDGSNYIRVGDIVKVKPSRPKKRDGFEGRVREIRTDDEGTVTELVIVGGPVGRATATRFMRPDRIKRVAQTRNGQAREMKR